MLSLKKLIFQNLNKNLTIFIASNKLVSTTASRFNDKKKGDYVKDKMNELSKEKPKVKLYPGFQDSIEEIRYGKTKEADETFGSFYFSLKFKKSFTTKMNFFYWK